MRKWDVVVRNFVEEVDFLLFQQETSCDRVHWCITPSLVEETAVVIEGGEVVDVCVGSEPFQAADFEIGPLHQLVGEFTAARRKGTYEMTLVISLTTVITQESHRVPFGDMLRIRLHEFLCTIPQRRDSLVVLIQTQHKTILLLVIHHVPERIKRDVAIQLNAGFHAPVVFVVEHELVTEKEARFVAAHVSVALGIAVDYFALFHVFAHLGGFVLINPFWVGPVFFGDEAVMRLSRDQSASKAFEFVIEFLVVQKDPVVVVVAIEAIFDFANRFGDFP